MFESEAGEIEGLLAIVEGGEGERSITNNLRKVLSNVAGVLVAKVGGIKVK